MTAIVIKLLVVFLVVMALVAKKQPIYVAVTAGAVVTWVLYGIPVADGVQAIIKAYEKRDEKRKEKFDRKQTEKRN